MRQATRLTATAAAAIAACLAWSPLPRPAFHGPGSNPGSSGPGPSGPSQPPPVLSGPSILPPGTARGGAATGAGGQPKVSQGTGTGARTAPAADRRQGGRGGAGTAGAAPVTFQPDSADSWEFWWAHNRDAILGPRAGARGRPATGSSGQLAGRGRRSATADDVASLVRSEVAPVLQDILRSESDPELCDSATLALARVSGPEIASFVHDDIRRGLRHPALSVRTSAVLSLGVLGDPRGLPLLHALMVDTPTGRQALGADRVPWQLRAYAAVAVGLINEASAVEPLLDAVRSAPASDRELRVAAVIALGLTDNQGASAARDGLLEILGDARDDPVVRAHAATSLAKLGDRSVLPALLSMLSEASTPPLVRQGVTIALGVLGDATQSPVVDALARLVTTEPDAPTRQLALIGLARVAARDVAADVDDIRRTIERTLQQHVDDPDHRADRSWAALAAGLYLHERPPLQERLPESLVSRYARESDPSTRGALAVAMGLAGLRDEAATLLEDLRTSRDDGFRGHLAVALGLLGHVEAAGELLTLCVDPTTPDALRHQAVLALGLLRDPSVTAALVDVLGTTDAIDVAWSISRALGRHADPRSIGPLVRLAEDGDRRVVARAFACVALGLVADKAPQRFNTPIQGDLAYLARSAVIEEVIGL